MRCRAEYVTEPQLDSLLPPVNITLPDDRQVRSDDPDVDTVLTETIGRTVHLATTPAGPPVLDEVWPEIDHLAPGEFIASTRAGATEAGETISEIPMAMFAPGTFFDLSALHVLTTSTLQQLAELEPDGTFDPRRYRPNFREPSHAATASTSPTSAGGRVPASTPLSRPAGPLHWVTQPPAEGLSQFTSEGSNPR